MKWLFSLLFFFSATTLFPSPTVIVSVAPQREIVKRIAGDTVDVDVLVPPGASPHFYEPTLKQILKTREGVVWFRTGEGFENVVLRAMSHDMDVIDVRQESDPHVWLSPRLLKKHAEIVAETLSRRFPENSERYQKNLATLNKELDTLDEEIRSLFQKSHRRILLVSHPAFYYFCQDYGCKQLSIESHGKEPSPKEITQLIQKARALKIDRVYLLPQYNDKAARRIARELGAKIVVVDPYAENVTENLKTLAVAFTQ